MNRKDGDSMEILRDIVFNTGLIYDIIGILIIVCIALVSIEQELDEREEHSGRK